MTGPSGAAKGAAAVSMVRNECDIIELFVRINLRAFDHLYIVDHGSSDGTAAILARLREEGLPLTVTSLADIHQTQSETLTRLLREAAASGRYRYVMPLDADEFFVPPEGWRWPSLDATLGDLAYGLVPWKTFVPVASDYMGATAPLHDNFRLRSSEPVQYYKAVVPAALARVARLGPGSHELVDTPPGVRAVELPLPLFHVPVRSSEQLVQKAVLGSHTLSIKRNRLPGEGFHWDAMAADIRSRGYALDDAALLRHALAYGVGPDDGGSVGVSDEPVRVGLPTDAIRHRDLARIEPIAAFDAFMSRACAEINGLNARLEEAARQPFRALFERLRGRRARRSA